jgi:hypothetical protein
VSAFNSISTPLRSDTTEATLNLLQLLGKHAQIISQAYNSPTGAIERTDHNSKAIEQLCQWRLMRADARADEVMLHSTVRQLIDQGLKRVRLQMISPDLDGAFEQILSDAQHYIRARTENNQNDTKVFQDALRDNVHDLCDSLTSQTQNIRDQIETQFGMVTQLSHKIKLNEQALSRCRAIHEALMHIDYERLYELGRGDRMLTLLFQRRISGTIDISRANLADSLSRLNSSMFHLKSLEKRARLVRQHNTHMKNYPDYRPANYTDTTEVAPIFTRAPATQLDGPADILDADQEVALAQLIVGLRKTQSETIEVQHHKPVATNNEPSPAHQFEDSPVRKAVRNAFHRCLSNKEPISTLSLYDSTALGVTSQMWLYAVFCEYSAGDAKLKSRLALRYEKTAQNPLSANYLIGDIVLWPR